MQPMTQPGDESEQNSSVGSHFAEYAGQWEKLPQPTPSITSTATPSTTAQSRFSRSVKRATTKKPAEKQDLDVLMKQHGITWGKHEGRRILMIPCTASEAGIKAVREALRNER